ncbi:MAG: F0F1 ATP synthase subunit delta [Christensenellaceae bacterium]|jgi:F0F1-type ATP synthase delta subunit|nr:F0F1 ATP synthase subunit delta [Christensenellaceae bacterium]
MIQDAVLKIAGPMKPEVIRALEHRFESLLHDSIEFHIEQDPSLIGGFAAYINGTVYDTSLLTQLKQMRKYLTSADE